MKQKYNNIASKAIFYQDFLNLDLDELCALQEHVIEQQQKQIEYLTLRVSVYKSSSEFFEAKAKKLALNLVQVHT